jgi:hypothetical protein
MVTSSRTISLSRAGLKCPDERFNGRIKEIANQTRFDPVDELKTTLGSDVRIYNWRYPTASSKTSDPIWLCEYDMANLDIQARYGYRSY